VLRQSYGVHLEAGTGPLVNPFPLDRADRRDQEGWLYLATTLDLSSSRRLLGWSMGDRHEVASHLRCNSDTGVGS
jgi:hypothetical protein